jgi:hypothetical protein
MHRLCEAKIVSPPPFSGIKSGFAFSVEHKTCHEAYKPLRRNRRSATQTKVMP